ncbi:MAG: zinc ribbon domain-containing protein [Chloroflexota bacterium]|nr:zinc ribbon domain-containing protein [Chloroflexota bacterium]
MPIYEYHCHDCKAEYELIRCIKDADNHLTCTHCQGENVKRKLSLFNAVSSGRSITSSGCSTCSGNNCSSCGGSH